MGIVVNVPIALKTEQQIALPSSGALGKSQEAGNFQEILGNAAGQGETSVKGDGPRNEAHRERNVAGQPERPRGVPTDGETESGSSQELDAVTWSLLISNFSSAPMDSLEDSPADVSLSGSELLGVGPAPDAGAGLATVTASPSLDMREDIALPMSIQGSDPHHLATDKGEFPAKPGELAGGFIGQDSGLVSPGLPAGLSGSFVGVRRPVGGAMGEALGKRNHQGTRLGSLRSVRVPVAAKEQAAGSLGGSTAQTPASRLVQETGESPVVEGQIGELDPVAVPPANPSDHNPAQAEGDAFFPVGLQGLVGKQVSMGEQEQMEPVESNLRQSEESDPVIGPLSRYRPNSPVAAQRAIRDYTWQQYTVTEDDGFLDANTAPQRTAPGLAASVDKQEDFAGKTNWAADKSDFESEAVVRRDGDGVVAASELFQQPETRFDGTVQSGAESSALSDPKALVDQVGLAIRRMELSRVEDVHEMQIELQPEWLGEMKIRIEVEQRGVVARFAVESHQVKAAIESGFSALSDQLQEQGLQLAELEVEVSTFDTNFAGQWGHSQSDADLGAGFAQEQQGRVMSSMAPLARNDEDSEPVVVSRARWDSTVDYLA